MDAAVAIFSGCNDIHASAVQWALASNGIKTFVASDVSMLASRISIRANDRGLTWNASREGVQLAAIRAIWFRRPKPPDPQSCMDEDKGFMTQQWTLFQKNVFDLGGGLIDALWINRPHAALAAESKLLQLQEARTSGLTFPEMVVTNNVEDVARLIKRWGRVVYKSFYPHTWLSASQGTYHSVGVVLLDAESELPEASIAMCPGIFQRYIDKKSDIRVTVVGNQIFAVEILKREGGAFLDWRASAMDDVTIMRPYRLTMILEQKIRSLMSQLGIVFGCIDLVVGIDGNIYFLEVNQAGQFLFVEDKVSEIPLLQAITAMLAQGRVDYSLGVGKALKLADYMTSDEYFEAVNSLELASPDLTMEH